MARTRRPFARAETLETGHYAVNRRLGLSSGPWPSATDAERVAKLWNEATRH